MDAPLAPSPPLAAKHLRRDATVVVLVVFALFASTLSANLAIAHDSLGYLRIIETNGPGGLFHPHHLLYNVAAALWLSFVRALGIGGSSFAVVSILNAVFGALAAGLVFVILRQRGHVGRALSLAGTALVVGSFGFWFYSVCVEVYIIPLFFLLAALYVLTAPALTPQKLAAVGALHGLAMVFHQAHVLFGLVVLAALWVRRENLGGRMASGLGLYLGVGTLVVVVSYGIALATLGLTSPEEAWLWFTQYAHQTDYWNPAAASTVAKAGVGFTRSFVGMHFAFALEPVQALMQRAFPDKFLSDEVFLVQDLSAPVAYVLLTLSAAVGVMIVGAFALGLRHVRALTSEQTALAQMVAAWLVVYTLFFFFWEPHNVEFWIPQSVCVWVLVVLFWSTGSERDGKRTAAFFAGLAVILMAVNYFGTVRFAQDPDRDIYRYAVQPLAEVTRPGDVLVLGRSHLMQDYVYYLTEAQVLGIDLVFAETGEVTTTVAKLREAIDAERAAGHAVFALASAVTPEPQVRAQLGEGLRDVMDTLWTPYRTIWSRQTTASGMVYYRIAPANP